ncbi:MAG: amidohydrolase family protein [Planctomycetota bacterium]|nr:amidohydrolase family protein [Planctomycetota bacterium]MDA1141277.1 amidohydrolase family protein [Planctomycetota bacterium]
MSLEFFDACTQIGNRTKGQPDQPQTLDEYIDDMEHHGISEAVVYHATAREFDPSVGNELLHREIAERRNLHPQWVVLPPDTRELPPPDELVSQMKAQGVSSARIFPKLQNFLAHAFFLGELLDALQSAQIPLFVEFGEIGWSEVIHLCTEFPGLRLVLTKVGYRETRYLPGILRKLENVTLDTALLANHALLEEYSARFGFGRFVYSSLWPFLSPANAITMIGYSALSDEARQAIASGNLKTLLGDNSNV